MFEKAYKFKAKSSRGQLMEGIIYAPNQSLAFNKLKRGQLTPLSAEFSLKETINGLTSSGFNKKELSRFYGTLGRRLINKAPIAGGLDAALEYLSDPRLKQSVILVKQAILDGQSEYQAMAGAGFPKRDCLVVQAAVEAGESGEAFIALSNEIKRTETLRKGLAATFRMPKIMAGFMAIFIWAAVTFIAPATLQFLKNTGLKIQMNALMKAYFDFVQVFQTMTVVGSIIYFSALVGLIYFLKSETFRSFSDKIETLRLLAIKSDQAATWNSFYLLFKAAVPPKEAGAIVSDAATRFDTKQAFIKLSKSLDAGEDLEAATRSAGFPSFITSAISAAKSSGNLEEGIKDMVNNLEEDVTSLNEIIQENAKLISFAFMGLGLVLVFMLTYYPMIASVLANV